MIDEVLAYEESELVHESYDHLKCGVVVMSVLALLHVAVQCVQQDVLLGDDQKWIHELDEEMGQAYG